MSSQMGYASPVRNLGQSEQSAATPGDMLRQFAVVFITVLTLVMNWAATALPLNGLSTEMISDQNPTFFTPAGITFAIWGVIYLGLAAYTVYQALPSQRANPRLRAIGWIYVVSGLLNSLWIYMWHHLFLTLCVLIIVGLLVSVILINQRLASARSSASTAERWTTHIPFSIYLGWLSVATIANSAIALNANGWSGAPLSPEIWAVVMLLVAGALGLYFGLVRRDVAFVLVPAWAFAGIAIARQGESALVMWVAVALSVAMVVVAVAALASLRSQPAVVRQ